MTPFLGENPKWQVLWEIRNNVQSQTEHCKTCKKIIKVWSTQSEWKVWDFADKNFKKMKVKGPNGYEVYICSLSCRWGNDCLNSEIQLSYITRSHLKSKIFKAFRELKETMFKESMKNMTEIYKKILRDWS